MNKRKVDDLLPQAYQALEGIAKNGEIDKGYRGQIAAFGAAVMSGSLLSAIAFFSEKGKSESERPLLLQAILKLIAPPGSVEENLFDYAKNRANDPRLKEDVFNAAVALKLAMNLYKLSQKRKPAEAE